MPVRSGNILANFFIKTLAKTAYLAGKITFSASKDAIWIFQVECIVILNLRLRKLIYTTKALTFLLNVILANLFLMINSTYEVVGRTFSVV